MHSECFELFAGEVSRRHPEELVVLVCDGAASHTATELSLPDNIRILTLPPYSPELNPTEQLWDLIRERRFANVAYDTLEEVEDHLAEELRALGAERDRSLGEGRSAGGPRSGRQRFEFIGR